MNPVHKLSTWTRRTFTWYFSAKAILALLLVTVSAASITATTTNYQAELGSAYNVSNNLLLGDKGFSKPAVGTAATGTCPTANVTFGVTPGNANNAITAGNIVYDVQVNETGTTPILKCFTVTISIDGLTSKSLTIASGSSVATGQTIDCKLDIGTTSIPTSPFAFKVTVQ